MEVEAPAAPSPSFSEALLGSLNAPSAGADGTPPAAAPPAAPPATNATTPPVATPAPPADENAWLKQHFPGYESPEALREAVAGLEGLRANQLTDDQRTVLALSADPAKWQEYNDLVHRDLSKVGDEDLLLQAFRQERPGMGDEETLRLFQREQDRRYPGIGGGEDDPDYKADLAERGREAAKLRERQVGERQTQLDALKKGALADSPAARKAAEDAYVQSHLDFVKQTVAAHPDGLKLTVDVGGQPLNLAVEAKDMPALQAVMENPFLTLLKNPADPQSGLDPQKLLEFAAWHTNRPAFLAAAKQAGQAGNGPVVSVSELHNAEGPAAAAAQGGDGSFSAALAATIPAPAGRPRY